jgi:hypothetical protein
MTLSKLLGTTLLAISLLMSSACSTNSQVRDHGQLTCPPTALEGSLGPVGEIPKDYAGVKRKLADVIGRYRTVDERYTTLLSCWERESEKRKGPR